MDSQGMQYGGSLDLLVAYLNQPLVLAAVATITVLILTTGLL